MARYFIVVFLPWILFVCISGAGADGVVIGTVVAIVATAVCDWRELMDKSVLS